jgi:hypothetical protein
VLKELCNFLRVHDPAAFGKLGQDQRFHQSHMFSPSMQKDSSSWVVTTGKKAPRVYNFPLEELEMLGRLYRLRPDLGVDVVPWQVLQRGGNHILGKLWTGSRYFKSLYDLVPNPKNNVVKALGKGECCVSFASTDARGCGGICYAIIRKIVKHQPSLNSPSVRVYVFHVSLLQARPAPPLETDVPLITTTLTNDWCWLTQKDVLMDLFVLRPHDSGTDGHFYLIKLI